MELPLPGIVADFIPVPDTGGCAPHEVLFDNISLGGVDFYWDFGDPASGKPWSWRCVRRTSSSSARIGRCWRAGWSTAY